jgi:polyisoprenoid-binding protein YceI
MRSLTTKLAIPVLGLLAVASQGAETSPAAAPTRYTQATSGNSLTFTFTQLGAATEGRFQRFATVLRYDDKNPAASSLEVTVQIASIDTQDGERDGVLATPELFDTQKFPVATFVSASLTRGPSGLEAPGKLTIRGVTRDLRLPLTIKPTATGLELSGQTTMKRLAFGIGQGDWQSVESVGDEVKVQYKVALVRAK